MQRESDDNVDPCTDDHGTGIYELEDFKNAMRRDCPVFLLALTTVTLKIGDLLSLVVS